MTDQTTDPAPDRPLVTFALFAYNQEQYIREAVEGAFAQTYEPLEIILSDDCSSDRTFGIMQEMAATYDGPHEVRVRRNEVNLGITGHFNRVFEISKGRFIALAAGDDISLPKRISVACEAMYQDNQIALFESSCIEFQDYNRPRSTNEPEKHNIRKFNLSQFMAGETTKWISATRVLSKDKLNCFPPLNQDCPTEDTPTLIRATLAGKIMHSNKPLVLRRLHSRNLSKSGFNEGETFHRIYCQYDNDLQHALSTGLTSNREAKVLRAQLVQKTISRWYARQRAKNNALSAIFSSLALREYPLNARIRFIMYRVISISHRATRKKEIGK